MSVSSAPLRLTLAEEPVSAAAGVVLKPVDVRSTLRCHYCGGDLLRSRLRRPERLIQKLMSARRPFRCQDCGRRRWRRWS
jgi:uncharacterized protein with PIN domain